MLFLQTFFVLAEWITPIIPLVRLYCLSGRLKWHKCKVIIISKYYTECIRAIIWTNDARIIVKRPRMLSTQSVALYKTCKPKPRLSTHICVTRPQWVKTEKNNELPIPGRFSNQIGILDIQSTKGILRFGVIFSKSLIYGSYLRFPKSWGRQNFNWFPIFTEFRV